jgi:broad specificity phosphatase PhoE
VQIYLVRHGETTGDLEDRYGGSYDDHLTAKGREQLAQTAQKFAGKGIAKIFSSPLIRAHESADIIRQVTQCDIQIVDGIKERHYGLLGGLTKDEAKERYPEAVERHCDLTYTHPDGESYPDCYARVVTAFNTIINDAGSGPIIILGHGGSIKCILKFLGQPLPDKIDDGGIIALDGAVKDGVFVC